MKKQYQKPMLSVENYALTQSVSACSGIRINSLDTQCVIMDPDSTNAMRNWAERGGFLVDCIRDLSGDKYDSVCYHTNINAAFSS